VPQQSLTPPVCSSTPETPTPGVKHEESSPHPYFGLRSLTPVRRTPTPLLFTTAGNSPFVSAETSPRLLLSLLVLHLLRLALDNQLALLEAMRQALTSGMLLIAFKA
jgi:hypothetical protein